MKLDRIFYTLCCMAMATMTATAQQQDSTGVKNKYFDAKDYLMQKRYIPKGRPMYKDAKGNNFGFGVHGGMSKLQGAGAWTQMMGEAGVSVTKDVSSFHSFRAAFSYGRNNHQNRMGLEIDHIFRIYDYVTGWETNRRFYMETVWGLGGYGVKPTGGSMVFALGGHAGLIFTRRISDHVEFYLEPRLNLFSDNIDALDNPRNYDIGFQGIVGLRYRLQGYKFTPLPTVEFLDNYFYEIYAGASGDFSSRTWGNLKMKTLGPTAGVTIGKWIYPIGFKGTLFGGYRYTPNATYTGKGEEPYMGLRLEGMVNINTFIDSYLTDPVWEFNILAGYELGYLAHKGDGVYKNKICLFQGPTVALQPVYFVRPDLGIFGQVRWSGNKYTQNLVGGTEEKRKMENMSIELGVQYRRRYEEIKKKKSKYKFEPYNMVSVQLGTNFPLHTSRLNKKTLLKELGQQFSLSYIRQYCPAAAVRGTIEAARFGFDGGEGTYPLTLGADFMLDALSIAGGFDPDRIVSAYPFVGVIYTHNETADKDNFGFHGGADLRFKVNPKWHLFLQGALRMYKGQITPSARVYTDARLSFVPNASLGVAYKF